MGLVISLMIHDYLECKEKSVELTKITHSNYIELSTIKLDNNDKHIIFNNNCSLRLQIIALPISAFAHAVTIANLAPDAFR